MATKVKQVYRPGEASSITTKSGLVTKVTIWNPGIPGSAKRVIL